MCSRSFVLAVLWLTSGAGFSASPIFHFNTVPRSDPKYQLPVTPSALESAVPRNLWMGSKNDFHRFRIHRNSSTEWTLHRMRVGSDLTAARTPRYRVLFETEFDESVAHNIMAIEPPVLAEVVILADLIEDNACSPTVVQGNRLILVTKDWKYLWLGSVLKYARQLLPQETTPQAALVHAWNDLIKATRGPVPVRYERCAGDINDVLRENPSAGPVELDDDF